MNYTLKDMEAKIQDLRHRMYKLIDEDECLTSSKIVEISQELDILLNQYYLLRKKINSDDVLPNYSVLQNSISMSKSC